MFTERFGIMFYFLVLAYGGYGIHLVFETIETVEANRVLLIKKGLIQANTPSVRVVASKAN